MGTKIDENEQEKLREHYLNWARAGGKELFESGLPIEWIAKIFKGVFSKQERRVLAWNFSLILEELEQLEREENNRIN